MFQRIAAHAVTIIAIAVVLALVSVAVASIVKDKKKKSGGCTGNCATCQMG